MAADPSQFNKIWHDAVEQYAKKVGKRLDDPSLPHLSSTEDLRRHLETTNDKFGEFREKKAKLFDTLKPLGNQISNFGKIFAGVAGSAFPPSTGIFCAIAWLVDTANGVSEAYDAINDLLAELKVNISIHPSIYRP